MPRFRPRCGGGRHLRSGGYGLGDRDEDQYGPATFAAPHQDGRFLIAVDATTFTTPILYTPDGLEWGDPPFDAPYAMVSQQCAAAGPWEEPPRGSLLLWVVSISTLRSATMPAAG